MTRLIDADALITAVLKNAIDYAVVFGNADMHRLLVRVIAHQPTIDAEPVRHGKWMFTPSDAFEAMFTKPKCSECGFESADGGNYCPNCGARMDEV